MILLHKINGDEFILNAYHIEIVEKKPDTIITLTNDKKYIVKESMEEVVNLTNEYKIKVNSVHSYESKE